MQENVDICVVGGGVVGMFCALEQINRGKSVRLIDKINPGSSRLNIGDVLLHGQSSAMLPFMKFTFEAWQTAEERFGEDLGFEASPSAFLAFTDAQLATLEQEVEEEIASGFESELITDRAKLSELLEVSDLPEDVLGAKISSAGGAIDTDWAMNGLRRLLISKGVKIWGSDIVTEVITEEKEVRGVKTNEGDVCMAGTVIVAAGVWANTVLNKIGINLPIRPARCHLMELSPSGRVPKHMMIHSEKFGDTLMKYQKNGRVLVAYTGRMDQAQATWSTAVDEACSAWIMEKNKRMLKSMQFAKVQSVRAVTTAITPDGHAYLGPVSGWKNIYVAAGFNGKSYAYAAGVGKILGMLINEEELPEDIDLSTLRTDSERFKENAAEKAKRQSAVAEKLARIRREGGDEKAEVETEAGENDEEALKKAQSILHPEEKPQEEWVDPFKRT